MTTSIWTGPGGTGGHPKSGDFEDAANWFAGSTPAKDNDVVFAPGRYTVTVSQSGYELGALTVGAGVTFVSAGNADVYGYVVVTRDSTNEGVISMFSDDFLIAAGASLNNFGEIRGYSQYFLSTVRGDGVLNNFGVVHEAPGSLFMLWTETQNEVGGVIDTRGGGALTFAATLTNNGLVSAIDGGIINFQNSDHIGITTNLSDGILDGGQWSAIGAYSTLQFRDGDGLNTIAAGTTVTLSGQGSAISVDDGAGTVTAIEDSLGRIQDFASFHVLGGRDYASTQDLDVAGVLELGGGTLSSNGMTVHDDATSSLVGFGVVTSDMDMYGYLRAAKNKAGETLALTGHNTIYAEGSLVGSGVLEIAGGVDTIHDGAQVLVKTLLVSGGELTIGEDLVYGGKLRVTGGGALHLGGDSLRVTGSLDQVNGVIDDGTLQIETTAVTVQGLHADWAANVRNNGEVDVLGGHLTAVRAVNGVGSFLVSGGATLQFGGSVSAGQTIDLQGAGDKLVFDHAQSFRGQVAEFGAGDTLDFASLAYAGATLSWKGDSGGPGGTLTVTSGADVAAIHLTDAHARNAFHLIDDGSGHAAVTYGAAAAATHADWGAFAI